MKKNKINYIKIFKYIIIIILIYLIFYSIELYEEAKDSIKTRTLEKDGFMVFHNDVYNNTTDKPCPELEKDILDVLPDGYMFIDYVYKINNVALSTFHRDVTSSQNIYNTKHKVYTCILYKYEGDLLSVCPNSHNTYPFVLSRILNIKGESGTVFLFDSNLLHAGQDNLCKDRNVIQYKLCHVDDIDLLSHLQKVNIIKKEKCTVTLTGYILRKLSYFFEFYINYIFYPFMIKKESSDTFIGKIQSIVPINYYNN